MARTDRFDGILERGWDRFRTRLAGRIAALGKGEQIDLAAETTGEHLTLVKIVALDARCIEVEMSGIGPSISPVRQADEIAHHVVAALREVYGVLHPTFLRSDEPDTPRALRSRVGEALRLQFGRPIPLDADGDFVVVVDSQAVFVVVDDSARTIQLWAPLLHGITGRARAAEELLKLNRAWPHIKLLLVEDRLVATIDVMGDPFVPRHLADLFGALRVLLGTIDTGFAQRFDGERYTGDTDAEPTLFDEPTVFDEPS
ncbi:hypothetical protein MWU77_02465 [Rhodococcus sp. F64268]|uniref:T3SS (YopN, CesT) and YbjN peptide-binding chaperone 1 n=1 Tax=Rhodococcus sp. F64268 TaxID=2926402 RepID=UPI001FF44DF7|nr:hypothetical protein [Rhodococcus sp. F64268]MCK0089641.1 hypothetical protein [Rhodococcus sp. F64268]